ncbi:MAG: hypothetical protein V7785_16565 [Bermanella sp.]
MMKWIGILVAVTFLILPLHGFANQVLTNYNVTLSYSDKSPATTGLHNVNKVLRSIGVRVSSFQLPEAALPIIKASYSRVITTEESLKLLAIFNLHRGQLLDEINKAGRKPEVHRGGFISISEIGGSPYPKVYDLMTLTPEMTTYSNVKYGKLHINSSDNGYGIDELATILSGGPWTWFFLLPDGVVGKLSLNKISLGEPGWRISYPGLVPHGGFLNAKSGLAVAYAHGPKTFIMRYEEPSIEGFEFLGTNPWIDLTGNIPKLID